MPSIISEPTFAECDNEKFISFYHRRILKENSIRIYLKKYFYHPFFLKRFSLHRSHYKGFTRTLNIDASVQCSCTMTAVNIGKVLYALFSL